MAQLVITLCDLCAAAEPVDAPPPSPADIAGAPVVVALGDAAPLVLDLCPAHDADLLGALRQALTDHGRRLPTDPPPPAAKGRTRGPYKPRAPRVDVDGDGETFVCLACLHRTGTASGLVLHTKIHHDRGTGADMYGDDPATCPMCGLEYPTVVGIAQHAQEHGCAGEGALHRLWTRAYDDGDPAGIVGKRIAELGLQLGTGERS